MSIDNNSQCVRSKYFVVATHAMDESLSDFQDTKKSCKGPKATGKPTKPKTRKVIKQIKGQKDIRTALKGKKNDLLSYTKEFDTVCKKAGVDVDSEQLQLAIALSKSLQTETSSNIPTSEPLTTQGRIAKIRTTLQEYGFKVPKNKITAVNKTVKKHKRQYKLLTTTEEERHRNITSRYSQILFENLDFFLKDVSYNPESETPLYDVATVLPYEVMKDNNIFYVDGLIEKSTSTGCLLRDWSEIPGRPVSPALFDVNSVNFSEIDCSHNELNVILSGCIKSAKQMIATKQTNLKVNTSCDTSNDENKKLKVIEKTNNLDDAGDKEQVTEQTTVVTFKREVTDDKYSEMDTTNASTVKEPHRSCSPDIFDDEVSCIIDNSKSVLLSQGQKTKVFAEDTNYMDITECANNVLSQNIEITKLYSKNITKYIKDDFMEITECAVSASQGIHENVEEIDLTQSPDEKSVVMSKSNNHETDGNLNYVAESPDHSFKDHDDILITGSIETMQSIVQVDIDPIQHSNKEDNSSIIIMGPNKRNIKNAAIDNHNIKTTCHKVSKVPSNDNIDLTQSNEEGSKIIALQEHNLLSNKDTESVDLTQSSNSSSDTDNLPEVNICNTQSQSSLDNTIILNEEEYIGPNGKIKKSIIVQGNRVFDLTQARDESLEQPSTSKDEPAFHCSHSFYEDFVHDHSDSKENTGHSKSCGDNNSVQNESKECDDIDLTQSSDESDRNNAVPLIDYETLPNKSSLGKKDDISIDYDEIVDYTSDKDGVEGIETNNEGDSLNLKHDSSKSQVHNDIEVLDSHNDLVLNSSQDSEVFDLTDKELDYSLHKSRCEIPTDNYNFDFGGISVMDNVSGVQRVKKSLDPMNSVANVNGFLGESFLPEVNLRKNDDSFECVKQTVAKGKNDDDGLQCAKPTVTKVTPLKQHNSDLNINAIVTPKNSEYIIKTDNVTPMLDYASMTTPQRNKELDKYGLKPFKRKRAIQILTHIYNQTHPVIEQCSDEDQTTPAKKPRQETNQPLETLPRNILKSPDSAENSKSATSRQKKAKIRNSKSPRSSKENPEAEEGSSKDNLICEYEASSEEPVIKDIDCSPDDWVFQKREKAKVHSCRVPLHIAFHNYVSSRRTLREAILKYEPVNIDVIHKDLVSYGHRYDPKDLLRFLDKKCITVKTTDNNARNNR